VLVGVLVAAALAAVLIGRGAASSAPPQAKASTDGGFLTLLFSRSAVTTANDCVVDDSNVERLDTGVAPEFAKRGITGTGTVETGLVKDTRMACSHGRSTMYASWAQLAALRDTYGWSFVSHSRSYLSDFSKLTPRQQWDETCGSVQDLAAHGHTRGDGLFAWPHSDGDNALQASLVDKCFAFGRRYSPTPETKAQALTAPYWNHTQQLGGGRCHNSALPCYTIGTKPARYRSPSQVGKQVASIGPGEWYTVQVYVLVTGFRAGQWDCRSSNWQDHWTSDYERYCWSDYLKVLDRIPAGVQVTDPKTVAQAWGRTGYAPPPRP